MIDFMLIKLASNCNFDCSYCYWFRDPSVRDLPALMSRRVADQFLLRLEEHIRTECVTEFVCSFHGGEPLLFGGDRLREFVAAIDKVGQAAGCEMRYALTTNGALIDQKFIDIFLEYRVSVTVSIDGPPDVHDRRRVTIKGAPTWQSAVDGYLALCRSGISPSIIAVCDPESDAKAVIDHLVGELGATFCDVLVPDDNHMSKPISISRYYIDLFNDWYENYADNGVEVRIIGEFVRGLLGLQTRTDSIGYAPIQTVSLSPDGTLETHDVLRIAGPEKSRTRSNIFDNKIAEIESDPSWQAVRDASLNLCAECEACRYRNACGGGHLAQRWSDERGYNNPSVYCADYKQIFSHIEARIRRDIRVPENSPHRLE